MNRWLFILGILCVHSLISISYAEQDLAPSTGVIETDFLGTWPVVAYVDEGFKTVKNCPNDKPLSIIFEKQKDSYTTKFQCETTPGKKEESKPVTLLNNTSNLANMELKLPWAASIFAGTQYQWLIFPLLPSKQVMIITGPTKKKLFIVARGPITADDFTAIKNFLQCGDRCEQIKRSLIIKQAMMKSS